jgi:hypothetical protein
MNSNRQLSDAEFYALPRSERLAYLTELMLELDELYQWLREHPSDPPSDRERPVH